MNDYLQQLATTDRVDRFIKENDDLQSDHDDNYMALLYYRLQNKRLGAVGRRLI